MTKYFCLLFFFLSWSLLSWSQSADKEPSDFIKFKEELDNDYRNPESSPLGKKNAKHFSGHRFIMYNSNFVVMAKAERIAVPEVFKMETSGERRPEYKKLFKLSFVLQEIPCVLYAYQPIALAEKEEYINYLFLPFTDKSNGFETYGGGRYIDLQIPQGDSLLLDFNKCYNPYCAYSTGYSCPVPPKENALSLKVEAGILAPAGH